MLLLLIFPVLVAGFFACHIHPIHAYKLHRYEGQYLYLKSAELGLKCFALACILALVGHHLLPDRIEMFGLDINFQLASGLSNSIARMVDIDHRDASKAAWFFILSFGTFLSAFVAKAWGFLVIHRRFGTWNPRTAKVYVIGELLSDSPLDDLLFKLSLQKDKYAMITLQDRKVYVGKVIDLGEPTETNGIDQDISIMPVMSGCRDKDSLEVSFKTFYEDIDADIYLSLRQDAILSVTEFNFGAYKAWNAAGDKRAG